MKITPLEIRQKSFEKHFRGYDKEEVHAFLLTLSQEWERVLDEHKDLRNKLENAEREVMKLREVETSLFKTLKTAEDTGANVIEQARVAADLHLRESQLRADEMINEAKMKANDTIDEAEQRSKMVLADMEERLRHMIEDYKKLESNREHILIELKRISEDIIDRVERARKVQHDFDADKHLAQTRAEIKKVIFPNLEPRMVAPKPEISKTVVAEKEPEAPKLVVEPPMVIQRETIEVEKQTRRVTSFFDEIG